MIRLSKLFLYFTVAVLLVWILPWCYAFVGASASKTPFTIYSSLLGDFIVMEHSEGNGLVRHDTQGNFYTQEVVDSLLPAFYLRQLTADERFPDSICGIAVSPKDIQLTNFTFKASPADINANQAELYFLLESMSQRVDLEMPSDAFRFTDTSIEFIDMAENQVNESKSALFTDMLSRKGFSFPAIHISGNATTRKDYDNGYLIVDKAHKIFHLKNTKGRPYVKAINTPDGIVPEYVFITEFRSRLTIGYMVDANHELFVINADGTVHKSGIPSFDPTKDELTIFGNMFDWTVRVSTGTDDFYYAIDANDYSLIKTCEYKDMRYAVPGLTFTSTDDKFVKPRF